MDFRKDVLAVTLSVYSSQAIAVVIVDEDFESYASDAEFHNNWVGVAGTYSPGTQTEVEAQFQLTQLNDPNADFNGDSIINLADYTIWRDNLGATGASQAMGDANLDGTVDSTDYTAWKSSFGSGPPPTGQGNVVEHLINYSNTDSSAGPTKVPDGIVVYQQTLNPNNTVDGSVYPSETEPVVVGVDMFVDSGLQRNTLGLRNVYEGSGDLDLVELGLYNSEGRGFAMRAALWQGSSPGWQYFDFDPSYDLNEDGTVTQSEIRSEFGDAWHRWEATITATSITATVDLNRDGINNATGEPGVDATLVFDQETNAGFALNYGFNNLRFGGPSSLYTTAHTYFDNIYLEGPQDELTGGAVVANVPEPSTIVLLALAVGGIWIGRRRS
ncbi:dockerin type I domain-containing protein [Aeoliella mucimassa]|uniref:PEP-CTERM motif protein n=1 Tax=Aeoliella mucimassa TaxID=2527972 RepID=A0A518AS52_9BACT|nr:dockerin type I domain-containing protein [Aeoliella mucimassa]QDU57551.1 PEP-CTERM motif protein [Aeoliella mucimassa]